MLLRLETMEEFSLGFVHHPSFLHFIGPFVFSSNFLSSPPYTHLFFPHLSHSLHFLSTHDQSSADCRGELTQSKYLNVGNHFKAWNTAPLSPPSSLSDMGRCQAHRTQQSDSGSDPLQRRLIPVFDQNVNHNLDGYGPINRCQSWHLSMVQGDRRTSCHMHRKWSHYGDEEWVRVVGGWGETLPLFLLYEPCAGLSGGIYHPSLF